MIDKVVEKAKALGFLGVLETIGIKGYRCFELLTYNPDELDAGETVHIGRPQLLLVKGSSILLASDGFIEDYLDEIARISDEELEKRLKDFHFIS